MHMYVCIYLSMYLRIYVSMYLRIHVSMYVCVYVCKYIYTYVCMYNQKGLSDLAISGYNPLPNKPTYPPYGCVDSSNIQ